MGGGAYREAPLGPAIAPPRYRVRRIVLILVDITTWIFWALIFPLVFLLAFDDTGALQRSLHWPGLAGLLFTPLLVSFLALPPASILVWALARGTTWWARRQPRPVSPAISTTREVAARLRWVLRAWAALMSLG